MEEQKIVSKILSPTNGGDDKGRNLNQENEIAVQLLPSWPPHEMVSISWGTGEGSENKNDVHYRRQKIDR